MGNTDNILKTLVSAVKQPDRQKPAPYDTPAEVRRVEDGIAWVHIPGGVDETPVKLTIAARPGDTVQIRVGGGSAWLVGNASAPPTDDFWIFLKSTRRSRPNQFLYFRMVDAVAFSSTSLPAILIVFLIYLLL